MTADPKTLHPTVSLLTRIPLTMAELVVFVVIVTKTWATLRMAHEKMSCASLICRDGALYFLCVFRGSALMTRLTLTRTIVVR